MSKVQDETRVMRLDDVVPYWRNPRVVTDEAVNAVAESIKRYGYQQPIVVDSENVIVMGHTRYAALRRLGATEAPVHVAATLSTAQAKQLRVIDNRTHELTSWDFEGLVAELDELDDDLMRAYFPEVVSEPEGDADPALGEFDLGPVNPADAGDVEFVCPSCFHEWEMPVTREAVMSGRLAVQ